MRNDILQQAQAIRASMDNAGAVLTDEQAVENKLLYPLWAAGVSLAVDARVRYGDKLYKCLQAHTSQDDWTPDAAPALWVEVNMTNAGTMNDPIPAERGMEYEYGRYYLDPDPEYGGIYLCQRGDETGTVVLHYLPHELTGNYFEKVE